jgi:hypothetical protein
MQIDGVKYPEPWEDWAYDEEPGRIWRMSNLLYDDFGAEVKFSMESPGWENAFTDAMDIGGEFAMVSKPGWFLPANKQRHASSLSIDFGFRSWREAHVLWHKIGPTRKCLECGLDNMYERDDYVCTDCRFELSGDE